MNGAIETLACIDEAHSVCYGTVLLGGGGANEREAPCDCECHAPSNPLDYCPVCGRRVKDFEPNGYENALGQRGHLTHAK